MIANSACRDKNGLMFLELVIAGEVQCLVAGDKDLLEIKTQFLFEIISPQQLKNLFA